MNESPSKIACMKRGWYMHVPNPVYACDGYAACMTHIQFTIHNWQLTIPQRSESRVKLAWTMPSLQGILMQSIIIHKSELMRWWCKRNPFGIKKTVKFLCAIKRKRWWYQLCCFFVNAMERNLNTKSLVVLAMAPRKQKTVESGGIGLMSDGREAHSVPFPIWRKFINRLAMAQWESAMISLLNHRRASKPS